MAEKSKIEWTESTWNPITGCTKISEGCQHCYAERMTRRLHAMGHPLNDKLKSLIADFVKGKRDKEPLFKSMWGRRYNRITAYYMIRDACKKVGLEERIGTHSMRKTFGYHHYQQFKDVALLQKIFNHSSQMITLRYIGIEQDQIDYTYNNFVL